MVKRIGVSVGHPESLNFSPVGPFLDVLQFDQGRSMSFTPPAAFDASSFSIFQRSLLQDNELPLTDVINNDLFAAAFKEHGVNFGADEDDVYTPAITLWALISQVFFGKEQRSCLAAVMRVAALWATLGRQVCDTNTGAYCRARLKFRLKLSATSRLPSPSRLINDTGLTTSPTSAT